MPRIQQEAVADLFFGSSIPIFMTNQLTKYCLPLHNQFFNEDKLYQFYQLFLTLQDISTNHIGQQTFQFIAKQQIFNFNEKLITLLKQSQENSQYLKIVFFLKMLYWRIIDSLLQKKSHSQKQKLQLEKESKIDIWEQDTRLLKDVLWKIRMNYQLEEIGSSQLFVFRFTKNFICVPQIPKTGQFISRFHRVLMDNDFEPYKFFKSTNPTIQKILDESKQHIDEQQIKKKLNERVYPCQLSSKMKEKIKSIKLQQSQEIQPARQYFSKLRQSQKTQMAKINSVSKTRTLFPGYAMKYKTKKTPKEIIHYTDKQQMQFSKLQGEKKQFFQPITKTSEQKRRQSREKFLKARKKEEQSTSRL